jgi:hypothetical protein
MRFVLNGESRNLTAEQVRSALASISPEPVREYGVRVGGTLFPVKQAFAAAARLPRRDFTSQTAARLLTRLSFEIVGGESVEASPNPPRISRDNEAAPPSDARAWPWEGAAQQAFVTALVSTGWTVTSTADTATKAPGVDVLALKGVRQLGAEVKGWPGKGYADPRRAHEVKPTRPTTQAGHWFSQALMEGLMLLDSHPGHESLVVLPDGYPRYRDLAEKTRTGRAAAGVHVVLVNSSGEVTSDSWNP